MQEKSKTKRLITSIIIIFVIIPIIIIIGIISYKDKSYHIISFIIAFLALLPFIIHFENKKPKARELIVISVMSVISTIGRLVFYIIPGFKPVTAITIITGMYMGPEAGFFTGALSALVSNIYFGQGPWTPFQMITWGLIGFIAGFLAKLKIMQNEIILSIYAILSGIAFSMIMDIWVVMSIDKGFNLNRYLAVISTSLPMMVSYAISNVIFLLLLSNPIGKKLSRIKIKYGI